MASKKSSKKASKKQAGRRLDYKIEERVEVRGRKQVGVGIVALLKSMKVGDHFYAPADKRQDILTVARRNVGVRVSTRKTDDGRVRVERVRGKLR
jgi:hypothetical protein